MLKEYKYKDGLLEKGFLQAKTLIKEGNKDKARDILDACIAIVAETRYTNGKDIEDELEGVKIRDTEVEEEIASYLNTALEFAGHRFKLTRWNIQS